MKKLILLLFLFVISFSSCMMPYYTNGYVPNYPYGYNYYGNGYYGTHSYYNYPSYYGRNYGGRCYHR